MQDERETCLNYGVQRKTVAKNRPHFSKPSIVLAVVVLPLQSGPDSMWHGKTIFSRLF